MCSNLKVAGEFGKVAQIETDSNFIAHLRLTFSFMLNMHLGYITTSFYNHLQVKHV